MKRNRIYMRRLDSYFRKGRVLSIIGFGILIQFIMYSCTTNQDNASLKRDMLFNAGWKFVRDSATGFENPNFDDSGWLSVDLPHDFALMDALKDDSAESIGPFSKNSPGNGNATGHFMGGTGWYRKSFVLDRADKGKTVLLNFDGVYMESDIWVNGKKVGVNKNGYTPFWFDITGYLHEPAQTNVIAMKVSNIGRNSRWYSGSGIYRNVKLSVVEPVHVSPWGVYITTPEVPSGQSTANVEVMVRNNSDKEVNSRVTVTIKDANDNSVGNAVENIMLPAKGSNTIAQQIRISNPNLWSIDTPYLYTAEVIIESNDLLSDSYVQKFGIRSIEFSAEKGFLLNGESVLLKGGCVHHDNGLLGAAAFDRAEVRRVELLKSYGYNTVRFSHNPPSKTFLEACDDLGMLVIDEFTDMWQNYKNPNDYSVFFDEWWNHDLTNMMLRDRNHPSIIMWSVGNEIYEPDSEVRLRIGKQLVDRVKELDKTRPATLALTGFFYPDGWETTIPMFDLVDVGGYNYSPERVEPDHQLHPQRIIYSSESYAKDAYDYWKMVEEKPYVIGDFIWTAWDYLGEAGTGSTGYISPDVPTFSGNFAGFTLPKGVNIFDLQAVGPSAWPTYLADCGDVDITGERRSQLLYRNVLWDDSHIELLVHEPIPAGLVENIGGWGWPKEFSRWNWKGEENQPFQVRVFTKASHVRLELNGKVVGEKTMAAEDKYIATFDVPYQPGELKAIAIENGKEVANKILKTTGEPAAIKLTTDRNRINADRNDLAYIKVEVVDENGELVPEATNMIRLKIEGAGELIASGNADPQDIYSFNQQAFKVFLGKAQAIVRPLGKAGSIKVMAISNGLTSGEVSIETK